MQIAVSPGSRALNWFCSQNPSLEVFPQFFVSTGVENPTNKLLTFNRTRGIYGIGAALYIRGPCSSDSVEQIPLSRSIFLFILLFSIISKMKIF